MDEVHKVCPLPPPPKSVHLDGEVLTSVELYHTVSSVLSLPEFLDPIIPYVTSCASFDRWVTTSPTDPRLVTHLDVKETRAHIRIRHTHVVVNRFFLAAVYLRPLASRRRLLFALFSALALTWLFADAVPYVLFLLYCYGLRVKRNFSFSYAPHALTSMLAGLAQCDTSTNMSRREVEVLVRQHFSRLQTLPIPATQFRAIFEGTIMVATNLAMRGLGFHFGVVGT